MKMTLTQANANPTLKGHKLLAVTPWDLSGPAQDFIDGLHSRFPGLEVSWYKIPSGLRNWDEIPEEHSKDVTLLATWNNFPTLDQAPNLQFVQLLSAGADLILKIPVFQNTSIPFCTANGVHG
jgi:hypothetical protein